MLLLPHLGSRIVSLWTGKITTAPLSLFFRHQSPHCNIKTARNKLKCAKTLQKFHWKTCGINTVKTGPASNSRWAFWWHTNLWSFICWVSFHMLRLLHMKHVFNVDTPTHSFYSRGANSGIICYWQTLWFSHVWNFYSILYSWKQSTLHTTEVQQCTMGHVSWLTRRSICFHQPTLMTLCFHPQWTRGWSEARAVSI